MPCTLMSVMIISQKVQPSHALTLSSAAPFTLPLTRSLALSSRCLDPWKLLSMYSLNVLPVNTFSHGQVCFSKTRQRI